jgi:hypothetical protein
MGEGNYMENPNGVQDLAKPQIKDECEPGPPGTLSGNRSERAAFRKEHL